MIDIWFYTRCNILAHSEGEEIVISNKFANSLWMKRKALILRAELLSGTLSKMEQCSTNMGFIIS